MGTTHHRSGENSLRRDSRYDGDRELFIAKELTKLHQLYIRDSAKDILEMFHNSTLNSRGEWVVIIKEKPTDRDSLSVDDIINMDIPPKVKSKLLSKITKLTTKEWYGRLKNNSKLNLILNTGFISIKFTSLLDSFMGNKVIPLYGLKVPMEANWLGRLFNILPRRKGFLTKRGQYFGGFFKIRL